MNNLELYEKVKSVPKNAQKTIGAGRLKGMTDINPMWRIKTLTEQFGPCGFGWYAEILDKRVEEGADGERVAIVDIHLYVKMNGEWSMPITGTGGSMLVAIERSGLHTSDEAFKMAYTDAISVACKALGMGAEIYWSGDNTKYTSGSIQLNDGSEKFIPKAMAKDEDHCCMCGAEITDIHTEGKEPMTAEQYKEWIKSKQGRVICPECIKKAKAKQ